MSCDGAISELKVGLQRKMISMDEQKKAGTCESGTCGTCVSCTADKGGMCSPMHWTCCVAPILSLVFWIGGIIALILAWAATNGAVLGMTVDFWYLNALALGVLAMGGRGKKFGSCRKGTCCGAGNCGSCKDGVCK